MGRRKRGEGKLGVVVGEFPSTSETFILREMVELERKGFDVVPLALRAPQDGEPHADSVSLGKRTVHRPAPFSGACLLGQIAAMVRYPVGYASALVFVLRHSLSSPRNLRELFGALASAGCLAVRIPRRKRLAHVHAQFGSYPATVGLLLTEVLGVTFSMSVHARDVFTNESILMSTKLSEAEFTTVCTRAGLERLQRQHRILAGDDLHLIHHGINATLYMPSQEPTFRPPVVLSVGRLVEKKGFDLLLRAAALARANGADFRLEIVGDGPLREDLERLTVGLALQRIVTFHGRMTQEELLPIYRRAHAFALASIVTEDGDRDGIPNVLIEALALGIPAIGAATGGIPELIEHEVTGLLAKPGDVQDLAEQLERIIYDEELRAGMREAGRAKVVHEFDISNTVDQLAMLLRDYVKPADRQEQRGAEG